MINHLSSALIFTAICFICILLIVVVVKYLIPSVGGCPFVVVSSSQQVAHIYCRKINYFLCAKKWLSGNLEFL